MPDPVTVTVLAGLPGSGKTTIARKCGLRFSLDDLRAMAGTGRENWSQEREDVAIKTMIAGAKAAILAGFDICIDNTHLHPRLPRMYRKEFGPLGVEWAVIDLTNIPIEECIARDAQRAEPVGEAVIRKMAATLERSRAQNWRLTSEWLTGTRYPEPRPYSPNPDLPGAYLVDVDGTVALNNGHRSPFDWSKVGKDEPNQPVIRVVEHLAWRWPIIFLSGRDESCRTQTQWWLNDHFAGFNSQPQLFMRPAGDMRPDYVVKAELFDTHVRDKYNVLGVFDDRLQVIRMWRQIGLTVFDVAGGEF